MVRPAVFKHSVNQHTAIFGRRAVENEGTLPQGITGRQQVTRVRRIWRLTAAIRPWSAGQRRMGVHAAIRSRWLGALLAQHGQT